jgi:hypothetical protein
MQHSPSGSSSPAQSPSAPLFCDGATPPAAEIAAALGGDGATSNNGWYRCPCPAHGGTNRSLSIKTGGPNGLHAKCFSKGCESTEILAAIDRALGTRFSQKQTPAEAFADTMPDPHVVADDGDTDTDLDIPPDAFISGEMAEQLVHRQARLTPEQQRARQDRILAGTVPITDGTLAARYLRQTRGLTLAVIPQALRQHPCLWHSRVERRAAAMVAVLSDHMNNRVALHRTFLDERTCDKAFGEHSRLALGPCKGAAVHLLPGDGSGRLLVAEGVETVLAAAEMAPPGYAVWSALSTSGLRGLAVPQRFQRVLIAADNDLNGAGMEAAETLATRLRRRGFSVRVALPKTQGWDWNDELLARCNTHYPGEV